MRRLLLEQLEPTRPPQGQELELQRWRLKVATHTAVIEPGSARDLLGWAFHSAVAHEASRWVKQELARQGEGLAVAAFSRSDGEYLQGLEGTAGGGMVRVLANGGQQVLSIQIEQEVVDPDDVEMLQDLVTAAVNDALTRSQEMVAEEMGKLTGGLNIPGLM